MNQKDFNSRADVIKELSKTLSPMDLLNEFYALKNQAGRDWEFYLKSWQEGDNELSSFKSKN